MDAPLLASPRDEESAAGLTSSEAAARLVEYGRNEIPVEQESMLLIFGRQFTGTMPGMLILSCVLAAAVEDYQDLGIIAFMLIVNACIAFYEETKAMASLAALQDELTQRVSVLRDGSAIMLDVTELVPGDVIALRGGQAVPADCLWVEGDSIKLDTAALTGEPVPWTIPRPGGDDDVKRRRMLSGCVVVQGECLAWVTATGPRTEIGQAASMVAASKAGPRVVGLFESKILAIVKMLIVGSLCATIVVFAYQLARRGETLSHVLLVSLSLVIGSVPIALPLVLQVTMALGARAMADHGAIVTHTTALQEIASMTVLNSDKTGTLTTAKMSIIPDMIWVADSAYTKDDCLVFAGLASNAANLDDPVDAAVFRALRAHFCDARAADPNHRDHAGGADARLREFGSLVKFEGFNPDVKRAVAKYKGMMVSKGLLDKILDTGGDGGIEQWRCQGVPQDKTQDDAVVRAVGDDDFAFGGGSPTSRADAASDLAAKLGGSIRARALAADTALSAAGYKTLAVCCRPTESAPTRLVGLVPMLDPPRRDTSATIAALRKAGIAVKMITGDHLNIARETSRLVGLGTQLLPNTALWPASATRDETIWQADGFAQVLPMDKREVVLVLQNRGLVVGMTGDGVNDAAALAQAQVGIAVEGATDAAANAADIVLTRPGLSAIYAAVYESRLIFRRLRAYVLYRVAATVQILVVLCILIFQWNDEIKPLYVVLLALLNDVTMTPIAHDHVDPSPDPELPETTSLLVGSAVLGSLQAAASIGFYMYGPMITGITQFHEDGASARRQVAVYAQISIAVELLIFACRAPQKPFLLSAPPSLALVCAVFAGNFIVTLMCAFGLVVATSITWRALLGIWVFDVAAFVALDIVKVALLWATDWLELNSQALDLPDVIAKAPLVEDRQSIRRSSFLGRRSSVLSDVDRTSRKSGYRASRPSRPSRASRPSAESLHERASLRTSLRPNTPANVANLFAAPRD